jgi:hypothetical protein
MMNLSESQIDSFYQTIETEKSNILNKMKEKNIDEKEMRKLNKLFAVLNNTQSNLLKLRQLIKPKLEC